MNEIIKYLNSNRVTRNRSTCVCKRTRDFSYIFCQSRCAAVIFIVSVSHRALRRALLCYKIYFLVLFCCLHSETKSSSALDSENRSLFSHHQNLYSLSHFHCQASTHTHGRDRPLICSFSVVPRPVSVSSNFPALSLILKFSGEKQKEKISKAWRVPPTHGPKREAKITNKKENEIVASARSFLVVKYNIEKKLVLRCTRRYLAKREANIH